MDIVRTWKKAAEPFLVDQEDDWLRKAYGKSELLAEKYWEKLNQYVAMEQENAPRCEVHA